MAPRLFELARPRPLSIRFRLGLTEYFGFLRPCGLPLNLIVVIFPLSGKVSVGDRMSSVLKRSASSKKGRTSTTKADIRVVAGAGKSPVQSTNAGRTANAGTAGKDRGTAKVELAPAAGVPNPVNPDFSPVRETVRDIVYTAKSYVSRKEMKNAIQSAAVELPVIPQAVIEDPSLEMLLDRDWRTYYSRRLTGKGLEIGPLHRPMVRHDGMVMDYIDRCTVKELREHYPELNDLPLVEPTILGDAETLANVKDKSYDFIIAAHVIEHMKNPLFALENWCRVVKPRGKVYLIVPDKRVTFDRNRVRTNIEHIIQDYRSPSADRDYDHFIDYAVHVQKKTGTEALVEAERLLKVDYSIHFHVFLPVDILNLINWFSENIRPVKLIKGPSMSPGSDEFHLLLQVG